MADKKEKVATIILSKDDYNWPAIANYLRNHSKGENGHILWTSLDGSGKPNKLAALREFFMPHVKNMTCNSKTAARNNGLRKHRQLRPQVWYQMVLMQDVIPETHVLKANPLCENTACISHFKMVPSKGNAICEMEEDEFKMFELRFRANCKTQEETGCILWQGYSILEINGHEEAAHRVALRLDKRIELNKGELVWHSCLQKACVNPKHLLHGNATAFAAWQKSIKVGEVPEKRVKCTTKAQSAMTTEIALHPFESNQEANSEAFQEADSVVQEFQEFQEADSVVQEFQEFQEADSVVQEFQESDGVVQEFQEADSVMEFQDSAMLQEFQEADSAPLQEFQEADSAMLQEFQEAISAMLQEFQEANSAMLQEFQEANSAMLQQKIANIDRIEEVVSTKETNDGEQKTEEEIQHLKDEEYFKSATDRIKANTTIFRDEQGVHLLWADNHSQTDRRRYTTHYFHHKYVVSVASYLLHHRRKESTSGMHIAHSCKFKHCVSPDHLSEKTPSENQTDRIRDGTMHYGQDVKTATLTNARAIQIFQSRKLDFTRAERAEAFGSNVEQVKNIDLQQTWSTITRANIPPITQESLDLLKKAKAVLAQRKKDGKLATIRTSFAKRKML